VEGEEEEEEEGREGAGEGANDTRLTAAENGEVIAFIKTQQITTTHVQRPLTLGWLHIDTESVSACLGRPYRQHIMWQHNAPIARGQARRGNATGAREERHREKKITDAGNYQLYVCEDAGWAACALPPACMCD
jgi:hypothetical protein